MAAQGAGGMISETMAVEQRQGRYVNHAGMEGRPFFCTRGDVGLRSSTPSPSRMSLSCFDTLTLLTLCSPPKVEASRLPFAPEQTRLLLRGHTAAPLEGQAA
jgi:hypothetical protein